jgi:hypothetical protein
MPIPGIVASGISGHLTAPSSFYSIATVTPTSGSTVSFTSIPGTYKSLQIRYSFLGVTGGGNLLSRFNLDTSAHYSTHRLWGDGSSARASGNANTNYCYAGDASFGSAAAYPCTGIINILDYAAGTKYATTSFISGIDQTGSGAINLGSGSWRNTTAITSITLTLNGDTFPSAGSTFALYGIN